MDEIDTLASTNMSGYFELHLHLPVFMCNENEACWYTTWFSSYSPEPPRLPWSFL